MTIAEGVRVLHPKTLWARLLLDGLRLAGIGVLVFVWWLLAFHDYQHDARAYWMLDLSELYSRGEVGGVDAFLYSPAFAQLFTPLTWLPWAVFAALWAALNLAAVTWLAGPVIAALLLVIPGSPVIDEVSTGNIHLMLAAAIALSFRWPATWSVPLLTKVTPGVGVLWHLGARQWRAFVVAVGVTCAVVAVSFIAAPDLWFEWFDVLGHNANVAVPSDIAVIPGPLWLKVGLAGMLALVGGWLGWRWTVFVAATLALPVPWSSGLSILVGLIWIVRERLRVGSVHPETDAAHSS